MWPYSGGTDLGCALCAFVMFVVDVVVDSDASALTAGGCDAAAPVSVVVAVSSVVVIVSAAATAVSAVAVVSAAVAVVSAAAAAAATAAVRFLGVLLE